MRSPEDKECCYSWSLHSMCKGRERARDNLVFCERVKHIQRQLESILLLQFKIATGSIYCVIGPVPQMMAAL